MPACRDIPYVLDKLNWMRAERIWPNGLRYTWTDAFGVVLLVSLYTELGDQRFLDEAEWLVSEVDRVLGRPRGNFPGKFLFVNAHRFSRRDNRLWKWYLTSDKVLKLINHKFLISDNIFHQITNRDQSNQFFLLNDWEMADLLVGHNRHTFFH